MPSPVPQLEAPLAPTQGALARVGEISGDDNGEDNEDDSSDNIKPMEDKEELEEWVS